MFAVASRPQGGLLNVMNSAGIPVVIAGFAEDDRGGAVSVKNGRGVQVPPLAQTEQKRNRHSVRCGSQARSSNRNARDYRARSSSRRSNPQMSQMTQS
jgi:hypothetical protein